jgi:cytochrome c oxidase cbb3-type subunit III
MNRIRHLSAFAVLSLVLLSACSVPSGQPQKGSEPVAPNQVVDFGTLYAQNCSGCHGAEGRGGAAIALANPVYLAIVDENSVHNVVTNGVHGTSMPPFAQSAGGMLTNEQIHVITNGIFSRWGRKGILGGINLPSYAAKTTGDAARGEIVFGTYCSSCHGPDGRGGSKASAISNDSFLALVSDQGLRTIVITGRPELGAPDWLENVSGKPMSDQEITDVVAWLASCRVKSPGQPYAEHPEKSNDEKQK